MKTSKLNGRSVRSLAASIYDNLFEGYPVTFTRVDGVRFVISMQVDEAGDEVYSYRVSGFGVLRFFSLEAVLLQLERFNLSSVKF